MQNNITLISDPEVLKIPIEDNNDPFIDLRNFSEILIDHRKSSDSSSYYLLRKSVAHKILAAQKSLPKGYNFLVVEGYRPLSLQSKYFNEYVNELRSSHSSWGEAKLFAEASKFVASPDITPPHCTGGAIDLTLAKDGVEVDMGTEMNSDPESSSGACFTNAFNISQRAKDNRKLLIEVLSKNGFINYPTEWWHWSYGDRYWAFITKNKFAIFGAK